MKFLRTYHIYYGKYGTLLYPKASLLSNKNSSFCLTTHQTFCVISQRKRVKGQNNKQRRRKGEIQEDQGKVNDNTATEEIQLNFNDSSTLGTMKICLMVV